MKRKLQAAFFIVCMFFYQVSRGQSFNLNANNGLATNSTYCLLVDCYGYLWIGTGEGVYRYNGYSLKKYDVSDGLPNKEVWWLYQDSEKRIWLYSISDQMGYIRNNRYFGTFNTSGKTLYPRWNVEYDSLFTFFSTYNARRGNSLCIICHDSVFSFSLAGISQPFSLARGYLNAVYPGDSLFRVYYDFYHHEIKFRKRYQYHINGIARLFGEQPKCVFHNRWITYQQPGTRMTIFDLLAKNIKTIDLGERIYLVFDYNDKLYAVCEKDILKFDTVSNRWDEWPINTLTGNRNLKGSNVSNVIDDPLWGKCTTTFTSGVFVQPTPSSSFKKISFPYQDKVHYAGAGKENTFYWWNRQTATLTAIMAGNIRQCHLKGVDNINRIIAYNSDSSIVISTVNLYWLNNRTSGIEDFFPGPDRLNTHENSAAIGGFDGIIDSPRSLYILSKTGGLYHLQKEDSLWASHTLDYDRYAGFAFDSLRTCIILYNNDHINIYRHDKKIALITPQLLSKVGIKTVEKILVDRFGNIFLKTNNYFILVDLNKFACYDLSANCVLGDALINLSGSILAAAGKFGILLRKIKSSGAFGPPFVYRNTKNMFYGAATEMSVMPGSILLKTDKGMYNIPVPDLFSAQKAMPFKVIALSGSRVYDIKAGDTILINERNRSLQLDAINPAGVGTAIYYYTVNQKHSTWSEASGNNIFLHSLQPGKYYPLSIFIQDDVWKSYPITTYVYIIPRWWQKPAVQKWLWALAVCLTLSLFALAVFITRAVIININNRRNARLELELKAIHAQINPHFIFNTLGVAQYFISKNKMAEATNIVGKFSSLLRAYIKSSRSKLVTIAEEIDILKDYIELQRIRFREKFDYDIIVDPAIDTMNIKIPSLLLQPIVENAINHGLFHKKEKGYLKIEFRLARNELICLIEDNGVGLALAKELEENSGIKKESYGKDLIADLIKVFKKYEQLQIEIRYSEKEYPLTGTVVEIKLRHY